MPDPVAPRAVGDRVALDEAPSRLLAWLEAELGGRIVSASTQRGGMSPGPASRVVLDTGARFFVKAVGPELNARTPALFRHEVEVLRRLPTVDYRPALLAAYDDGAWVAIVLEDVEGAHPDLDDESAWRAAREVVRLQSRELTPDTVRLGSESLAGSAARWRSLIGRTDPEAREAFPAWWHDREPDLMARLDSLPDRLPPETWCHTDIRDDNLLQRPDGSVAVVDWGMSKSGPAWVDELFLDLHVVAEPSFDERVAGIPAYGVPSDHGRDDTVTDLLLALGMTLLVTTRRAHGLPRLASFRRAESRRLLAGAARRLGVEHGSPR